MLHFAIKRLWFAIFVLLGVATVSFFMLRLSGDPVLLMLPTDASPADVTRMRHLLGFDRPLAAQYVSFLSDMARGSFGKSLRYNQPSLTVVLERLPATGQLAMSAFLFSVAVAVPLGVVSAVRHGTWVDSVASLFALVGQAAPVFWLGLMGILLFSVRLHWLPSQGRGTWLNLVMPMVALGLHSAALTTRMMRGAMLEVLHHDYIRTARSKGLSERAVIYRHALKNALVPVITVLGLQFGSLLSGSVVTETVFAWPGVGRLMVQSINTRDFPVVQTAMLAVSLVFVLINLVVDLTYGLIDPRIRYN